MCPRTLRDGHSSANTSPSNPSSRLQRRERSSLARGWECPGRCMPSARPPAHLSKMAPTPALCALLRCTCSPVASRIPSFTAMERWEKEAIRSSFHPALSKMTWSSRGSSEKWGILLAHSTRVKSCLSAAWHMFVTGSLGCQGKQMEKLGEGRARRREAGGAAQGVCCLPAAGKDPKSGCYQEVTWLLHPRTRCAETQHPSH